MRSLYGCPENFPESLSVHTHGYYYRNFKWTFVRMDTVNVPATFKVRSFTHITRGTGKATDFKCGRYIHSVHPNKSPFKILEKRERRRIQGLTKVFKYPLLSQERIKLRTEILYARSYDRSEQKSIKNFGNSSRGCTQGLWKIFRAAVPQVIWGTLKLWTVSGYAQNF